MNWFIESWPWYIAGPMLALVMLLLVVSGKSFGMSANLRTMCSIAGAGRVADFFKYDWKANTWNLIVMLGAIIGGYLAANYLSANHGVEISTSTIDSLQKLGFQNPGESYLPNELFSLESVSSTKGFLILAISGLLIGFGTRYAGGCTSGHAISGLSNLQWPSLISVVGFFIGGLIMTHFLIPIIFH